jgi:Tol biopolymer transport system component
MSYDVKAGQKKEIYRSSEQIIRMDISADGKWLAFLEAADSTLKVMPPDGGQPQVIYRFDKGKGWSTSVAWSPDGKYIYFTRGSNGKTGRQELWRIPSAGGEPVRFDLAADGMENLDIHPDGRRITFNSWRMGADVWVMENFLPKRKDDF